MEILLMNFIIISIIAFGWTTAQENKTNKVKTITDSRCPGDLEIFSDCGALCQPTCAEPNGANPCQEICMPGCVCSPGLVRNATADCIPATECTPTSMICPGANEVVSRCDANECQNTCVDPFLQASCDSFGCTFGCVCQEGFLRDCNGNCVFAEGCVVCDDPNAHFSNSLATICQNTCDWPTLGLTCKPAGPVPGCICNDGFLKDDNGICQQARCCVSCSDPNAEYSLTMATSCQNTCQEPDLQSRCVPDFFQAGCICKEDLVKNSDGICIPLEQCNDPRCPSPTQVWTDCDALCQRTCASPEGMECDRGCTPGCVCAGGLVKTAAGECICPSECTADSMVCPGPNEIIDLCGANGCQNTCDNPSLIAACDPLGCSFGCICQPGFLRDCNRNCVSGEDCVICSDPNAHFNNTDATACQNTCAQPDLSTYCTPPGPEFGCVCNEGFLMDADTVCQPAECCAICDDPNAHFSLDLATPCQNTCEEPDLADHCEAFAPQSGCICNDGFIKNSRGLCVIPGDCCNSTCGINEHFEECAFTCPPQTCDTIGIVFFCPVEPPTLCEPGCRCNPNYFRDGRGICVPIEQCPPLQCLEVFEVYNPCPPPCPTNFCTDPSDCTDPCDTEVICLPKCLCMDGYAKQKIGNDFVCVPREECTVCSGNNEEYRELGPSCEPTCSTLYSDEICIDQVQSGCFCMDGFIRDSFKNCIPVNQCFMDICLENEVRSCGSACDTTCATLGIPCPIINIDCNNMCYCMEGFARDDCGRCIPIDQCPANPGCGTDLNAVAARCPNKCPETCEDCVHPKPPCVECGTRPGCDCIDGYIIDETTGFCVKPGLCYSCTGPNEVFSANIDCTCDDLASGCSLTAPTEGPVEGCRCKDGYVRDALGICISAGTCPRCPELEEFSSCGSLCPITCANINNPPELCPDICIRACFCKEGLIRNQAGECVEPENCPAGCNGDPNSSSVTCPEPCPVTCTNFQIPPPICLAICVPFGCQCNTGYVLREDTGVCVLPGDCPVGCGRDPNARRMLYPPTCVRTCDNYMNPDFFCDENLVEDICVCLPNFVLDTNTGLCVTPDMCPAGCNGDLNAVHATCGNICPRTCELQGPRPCPRICLVGGGCVCKPGFVEGGPFNRCILPEECPYCGNNAEFSCGSACQNTCNTLGDECQIINVRCTDDCFCDLGYARDASGRCVPEKKCPPKIGCRGDPNAHIESCPGALCSVTCENYFKRTKPYQCDEYCRPDGKCVCNPGTIRDETTDYCVSPTDCYRCWGENQAYYYGIDITCDEAISKGIEKILKNKNPYLGCHCKVDYVLNDAGICIPSQRCPRCRSTEQYTECGTACPPTCSNRFTDIICINQCVTGCYCRDPLIRNDFGVCVPPSRCPSEGCGVDINASLGSYIPGCVPTCDNPLAAQNCPLTIEVRVDGCVCNANRVLNTLTGLCVMEHECPPGCGGDYNAEYSDCQDNCPLTCSNMDNPPVCIQLCIFPGECRCKYGYVRSDVTGRCISPKKCYPTGNV